MATYRRQLPGTPGTRHYAGVHGDGLVVGFDLDMTLVDPRAGVVAAMAALESELGAGIDAQWAAANLGPPAEMVLARWLPPEAVQSAARRYRELFEDIGLDKTTAMPGAANAIDAVRSAGGRVIVVTAKYEQHARASLEAVELRADAVYGLRFAAGKADPLLTHGARVYVGDHTADVLAARASGAIAVTVASGPASRSELVDAGADAVLETLHEFPAWLAEYLER